jgi:HEAT repeat protein
LLKKWIVRTALGCVAVLLLTVAGLALARWLNPEPRIQGRALSEWLAQLRSTDPAERQAAAEAVTSMGPDALPYLTGTLTRPPSPAQKAALSAAKYVPRWLKGPLSRIYSPSSEIVNKHTALYAISLLGTNATGAATAVGQVLREPHVALSGAAAATLIRLGTNALPELIAALSDGNYTVRVNACNALANLNSAAAPAIPRLGQIVVEERGAIRSTAVMTLARIGEPAVPLLTGFLANTNAAVRQSGAYAFAHLNPPARSALPLLIKLSSDSSTEVRVAAIQAVGRIGDNSPEIRAVLLGGLDDPDGKVRAAAAGHFFLRQRVVRENEDRFYELLEDEEPEVRAAAANALGQTGEHGVGAIPHLRRLLEDTNSVVSISAAQALRTITNCIEGARAKTGGGSQ